MPRIVPALAVAMALLASPSPTPQATPSDIDALLAPIALYPDQLLAQILLAAANPGQVGTLDEWLRSQSLTGTALQDAAAAAGFEDSLVALTLFPDVVHTMASKAEWTGRVGVAFASDRSAVFASIQRLRKKASDRGALKSTPQQSVETKTTSGGEQVIVIEPANPQVVYVPQYNPQVVYTQPSSTTVVVQDNSSADAAVAGMIGFTAGIAIGAAFDNNYYYGPYGWHGGAYMYNDAWDDYYDHREDAREDWQDHREDMADERGDRAKNTQEQRTERRENTQQSRTDRQQSSTQSTAQQSRTDRQQTRQESRPQTQTQAQTRTTNQESRGFSSDAASTRERSGSGSSAFSGYSSGKSERAASSRGQKSRSSSRSSGSRRR
jgi:hypothetical protein